MKRTARILRLLWLVAFHSAFACLLYARDQLGRRQGSAVKTKAPTPYTPSQQHRDLVRLQGIVRCQWRPAFSLAGMRVYRCPHIEVTPKFLEHGVDVEATVRAWHE